MKRILSIVLGLAIVCGPSLASAVCSAGNTACSSACNTSCSSAGGVTFGGMCAAAPIGSATQCTTVTTQSPLYVRCSGAAPACVSGPLGVSCKSDGDCPTGSLCVSSNGLPGCGTGFAVCAVTCTSNS